MRAKRPMPYMLRVVHLQKGQGLAMVFQVGRPKLEQHSDQSPEIRSNIPTNPRGSPAMTLRTASDDCHTLWSCRSDGKRPLMHAATLHHRKRNTGHSEHQALQPQRHTELFLNVPSRCRAPLTSFTRKNPNRLSSLLNGTASR